MNSLEWALQVKAVRVLRNADMKKNNNKNENDWASNLNGFTLNKD